MLGGCCLSRKISVDMLPVFERRGVQDQHLLSSVLRALFLVLPIKKEEGLVSTMKDSIGVTHLILFTLILPHESEAGLIGDSL